MKLPQGDRATVDIRKLSDYYLNGQHPRGRNKARVFASYGVYGTDAETLRSALLVAAREEDAQEGEATEYGRRYVIDFDFNIHGRTVNIRSSWIAESGPSGPRLTSCYVL